MTTVQIDWQDVAGLSRAYAGGAGETGRLALHQGAHTLDVWDLEALPMGAGTVVRARQQSAALVASLSSLGAHLGEDSAQLARIAALGALAAGGTAATAAAVRALAWLALFDPSVTSPAPADAVVDHVTTGSLSDLVGLGPLAVGEEHSVELAELVTPDGRRTYRATTTVSANLLAQNPGWSINGVGIGANVVGTVDGAVTLTWDFDTAQRREGFLAELALHEVVNGGSGPAGLVPYAAGLPRLPVPTARTVSVGTKVSVLESLGLFGMAANARFSHTTTEKGSQDTLSGGYQPTMPNFGDHVIDRQMAVAVDRDTAGHPTAVSITTSTTVQEPGIGTTLVDNLARKVRITVSHQTLQLEGQEAGTADHLFGDLLEPTAAEKALLARVRACPPAVTVYDGVEADVDVKGFVDGVDLGGGAGVKNLHRRR